MKKIYKIILLALILIINFNIILAQNNRNAIAGVNNKIAVLKNSNDNTLETLMHNEINKINSAKIETPLSENYLYAYPPYPMPAKECINCLLFWDSKLDINNAKMCVYDMNCNSICGKEKITLNRHSDFSGIVTWNSNGVSKGIYFIQIIHGTRTSMIKVIIE
jgi:hypothetical protein